MLDKYRDTIASMGYTQEWYDSYNTAIRVTRNAPGPFPPEQPGPVPLPSGSTAP